MKADRCKIGIEKEKSRFLGIFLFLDFKIYLYFELRNRAAQDAKSNY